MNISPPAIDDNASLNSPSANSAQGRSTVSDGASPKRFSDFMDSKGPRPPVTKPDPREKEALQSDSSPRIGRHPLRAKADQTKGTSNHSDDAASEDASNDTTTKSDSAVPSTDTVSTDPVPAAKIETASADLQIPIIADVPGVAPKPEVKSEVDLSMSDGVVTNKPCSDSVLTVSDSNKPAMDPAGKPADVKGSEIPSDPIPTAPAAMPGDKRVQENFSRNPGSGQGFQREKQSADLNKTFLSADKQSLAKGASLDGTAAANQQVTMSVADLPSRNSTFRLPTDAPLVSAPLAKSVDGTSQTSAPSRTAPVESRLVTVVSEIAAAADRIAQGDKTSVNLHFDFGTHERLAVRVEWRNGDVHTVFRTDSPQLRESLSSAWKDAGPSASEKPYKFAEPVFAGGSSNSMSQGTGDGARQRQRFAEGSQTPSFSLNSSKQAKPVGHALPVAPSLSTNPDADSLGRLQTFA